MFHNREGQSVPNVTFRIRDNDQWKQRTTEELFSGRTVILFSLPGAFTPTCSSSHVPRYDELADTFKELGVDEIVCVSVNDTFVMNAWKQDQHAEHITFIPDGNGTFTEGMGMLVSKDELGFGKRSWRYSMLVRNGIVEKMFIEPEKPGDPFEVSDADTMLHYLAPTAASPLDVVLFTKPGCSYCTKARRLLNARGIPYAELPTNPRILRALPGQRTTPQIFINGHHIGGADELETWLNSQPA